MGIAKTVNVRRKKQISYVAHIKIFIVLSHLFVITMQLMWDILCADVFVNGELSSSWGKYGIYMPLLFAQRDLEVCMSSC